MTRFPIRQRVVCHCPGCNREVPQERSTYPDVVFFTCLPNKHHWTYYLSPGEFIPGDPDPGQHAPKGYGEEDEDGGE